MLFSESGVEEIAPGALLFRGAAEGEAGGILEEIDLIVAKSPFRRVVTPMGKPMSVEMTNCGSVGWVSDRSGYRYETLDPVSGRPWPKMPARFHELAIRMAEKAGYQQYLPDVCLINRYSPGSKMGMHQDRDERDFSQPIVSVSLGVSAIFRIGGASRTVAINDVKLNHGDIVVFGGPARLSFHSVRALRRDEHLLTGPYRYNLTFRVS
jgi:alkylated DNA repair protein (DNA oxidative demethylase)